MLIQQLTAEQRQDALGVLRDARALLTEPGAWTKGAMCRRREQGDSYIDPCDETSLPADKLCFCLAGALMRASCSRLGPWPNADVNAIGKPAAKLPNTRSLDAYDTAVTIITPSGTSIVDFNDCHITTHADILALFDRAIRLLERRGGDQPSSG